MASAGKMPQREEKSPPYEVDVRPLFMGKDDSG
jgi:hypothetical protein